MPVEFDVLLPVFNGEDTIAAAIDSIKAQTLQPQTVVVVLDGSTDSSTQIVQELKTDQFLIIENSNNKGLSGALQLGLCHVRSPLLARHDQDDVSHPRRFERQVDKFRKDPTLVALGTQAWIWRQKSATQDRFRRRTHLPQTDAAIRWRLLYNTPFVHGSTMLRTAAVLQAGGYEPANQAILPEDYSLWIRLQHFGKLMNLDDVLLNYFERSEGMSSSLAREISLGREKLSAESLARFLSLDEATTNIEFLSKTLGGSTNITTFSDAFRLFSMLFKLRRTYARTGHSVPAHEFFLSQSLIARAYARSVLNP